MVTRVITSLIGIPILIFFIVIGGIPLQLASFIVSLIGMAEIYSALSTKQLPIHFVGYLFAFLYFFFIQNLNSTYLLIICTGFLLAALVFMVFFNQAVSIIDCAITIFGFYYVPVLLSFVYMVRQQSFGEYFIWLIFICAWGCDSGAFFAGTLLGKHKLAPVLSPKKTVEGAIGGVLFSALLAFIFAYIVTHLVTITTEVNFLVAATIIGATGAIFAQFGDLAASAIKRHTKIKDFGKIIPGHGGVIDRFDSVMFTAPGVFILMLII